MNIGSCSYGPGTRSWQNTGQHPIKRREINVKSIISALAVLLTAGLLLSQTGCTEAAKEPAAENPALTTPVPAGMARGTVLETMDSGGYTYVAIETSQGPIWAAGPQTSVKAGDVVEIPEGMPMNQFTSKTLGRTFDVLFFVNRISNLTTPAPVAAGISEPAVSKPAANDVADVGVEALEAGKNIAWVFANTDSLADQQVSLRATVVKYNSDILGWNFIHIQDGSGDVADRNNDLTVTSKHTAAVGDTVVLTGTIILDKDFGAGYSFPVLLEDASISNE
jgi:hypothetical protein